MAKKPDRFEDQDDHELLKSIARNASRIESNVSCLVVIVIAGILLGLLAALVTCST